MDPSLALGVARLDQMELTTTSKMKIGGSNSGSEMPRSSSHVAKTPDWPNFSRPVWRTKWYKCPVGTSS